MKLTLITYSGGAPFYNVLKNGVPLDSIFERLDAQLRMQHHFTNSVPACYNQTPNEQHAMHCLVVNATIHLYQTAN
jgi:hypothetical protein